MNIVILGGAGRVGRRIADLAVARGLGDVTVADLRVPLDGPGGRRYVTIDLSDDDALDDLMATHDLVINCVGPFDLWGTRVLDAAIANRTDYFDICDDPEPTVALLDRNEAAQEAGVRAVIGLGASPGLSNLLAVVAASQLTTTRTLVNYWGDPHEAVAADAVAAEAQRLAGAFRSGRAAMTHVIAQAAGSIPIWRNGAPGLMPAWNETYRVRFSTGESGLYRPIGHPEPLTVPRLVETETALCIGTLGKGADLFIAEVLGRVASGELTAEEASLAVAEAIEAAPHRLESERHDPALPALIGAVAMGLRDGRERSVVVIPGGPTDGSMSFETARPCALGIELLERVAPGVHAPESAFDAVEFLTLFSDREWGGAAPYRVDEQDGAMFEVRFDSEGQ